MVIRQLRLLTYLHSNSSPINHSLYHLVQILPKQISNFNFFMSMSHPMEIHQQSWPIHSLSCSQYVIMIFMYMMFIPNCVFHFKIFLFIGTFTLIVEDSRKMRARKHSGLRISFYEICQILHSKERKIYASVLYIVSVYLKFTRFRK